MINANSEKRKISIFTLAMINVAAIVSLKNLPLMAEYGLGLVFFFIVAAAFFFIPTALVSAELATGWPKRGGVYVWIREGLGSKWGFLGIWLQWIENVIWYPTILSFAAGALAYLINPALAGNKVYTIAVVLTSFWLFTVLNFFGMKASGLISSIGVIGGTILPGILIIGLGIGYLFLGKPIQIDLSFTGLIPDLTSQTNIVYLVGVLLAISGMEMSAVHAQDVKNPRRGYPKAILLSALIILLISILGSLAIAIVVPKEEISLVTGVMEAFAVFFHAYHLDFIMPFIAAFITVGALGMVSTWIIGPSKGLLASADDGDLPPIFDKTNRFDSPVPLLILQAVIVTILSLVFLLMPTVSSSYWILSVLTAQIYLIMYLLLFVSAIRLRYTKKDVERPYRVPGGNFGMWLTGSVGIFACLFALIVGFFPPKGMEAGSLIFYEGFLVFGIIILGLIPIIIIKYKPSSWKASNGEKKDGS